MNLTDSFLTRPKSYDNIDFAKAVFEILTSEICPHGHRKYMFCGECYEKIKSKKLRDKYHEQHPDARYFKHHNP